MGVVTDRLDDLLRRWDGLPDYGFLDRENDNFGFNAIDVLFIVPVLILSLNLFGFYTSTHEFTRFGFSFQLADILFSTTLPVIGQIDISYATLGALASYGSIYTTNQIAQLLPDTITPDGDYSGGNKYTFSQVEFMILGAGLLVIVAPVFSATAASILTGQYMAYVGFIVSMASAVILAYY